MVRRAPERGSRRDLHIDDDAWHAAMLRTDQAYRPMIAPVDSLLAEVANDEPARTRLVLTRELLAHVDSELADLARRWQVRRTELTRERGV